MINARQEGETRETREKMKMRRRKPLTNTFRREFLNNPPFSPLSIHFYHEFEPRTKRFQLLFTLTISLRNKISSFPYLFIYITLSLSYSFFLKERKKRIHLEPFDLRNFKFPATSTMGRKWGKVAKRGRSSAVKNRSNDNPKDLHGAAGAHAMGRGGVCTRKLAVIPLG